MKDSKVTALEIVQLPTDEFVVRKAGEETALLTINISEEFKKKLDGLQIDLASKMLIAGIEYLAESSQIENARLESKTQTIH
ncbi:MAG: ABC transporter ATP-binding protein [Oceanospirillaceae bacterium]